MLSDHGYFVMLFAQVENQINSECEKLIARKRAAAGWRARRLWDDADADRMPFMQKVSLLCERGHAVYNRVYRYYSDFRCKIAHGNSAAVGPINLPVVAQDLLRIARLLRSQGNRVKVCLAR
jgi:hypothetical protein